MRYSYACVIAAAASCCALLNPGDGYAAPPRYTTSAPDVVKEIASAAVPVLNSAATIKLLTAQAIARDDYGALDTFVTRVLGLGQEFDAYQIDVKADPDVHLYNVARDGRVILTSRIDDVAYYFLLDPKGRPTAAAVRYPLQPHMPVSVDSVHTQLSRILDFWVDWADRHRPPQ